VGEILASLQSFLASLYGLNEAGFFFEIARKNVLHQFVRIEALLGGGVCELRFEFGGEMHFHRLDSLSQGTPTWLPEQPFARERRKLPMIEHRILKLVLPGSAEKVELFDGAEINALKTIILILENQEFTQKVIVKIAPAGVTAHIIPKGRLNLFAILQDNSELVRDEAKTIGSTN
jgi:hypothetical protein